MRLAPEPRFFDFSAFDTVDNAHATVAATVSAHNRRKTPILERLIEVTRVQRARVRSRREIRGTGWFMFMAEEPGLLRVGG